MPFDGRLVSKAARSAHLGAALLQTTVCASRGAAEAEFLPHLLVPVSLQDLQHLAAQADRRADDRRSRSRSSARTHTSPGWI